MAIFFCFLFIEGHKCIIKVLLKIERLLQFITCVSKHPQQTLADYTSGLQLFGFLTVLAASVNCMRLITLTGLLLLSFTSFGQKYDLFEVEGDDLFWRYTYTYTGPADSLRRMVVSMLKSKKFTQNVIRNEIGYNGELRHYQVDCRRYGRTYSNTPRIYWDGEWSGKFVVEVRDNQYRVSIYALYFENTARSVTHYRNELPRKGFYIKEVLKKSKTDFKKSALADMALMSLALKDQFDIRQYNPAVKDW